MSNTFSETQLRLWMRAIETERMLGRSPREALETVRELMSLQSRCDASGGAGDAVNDATPETAG